MHTDIQIFLFSQAPDWALEYAPRAKEDDPVVIVSLDASADLRLLAASVAGHLARQLNTKVKPSRHMTVHAAYNVYTMER